MGRRTQPGSFSGAKFTASGLDGQLSSFCRGGTPRHRSATQWLSGAAAPGEVTKALRFQQRANRALPRQHLRLATALFAISAVLTPALAEKRVALAIGNSNYREVPTLANPRNDAEDVAAALSRLGFETTIGLDADRTGEGYRRICGSSRSQKDFRPPELLGRRRVGKASKSRGASGSCTGKDG
jgi:Caspase domain